ncbi:isoprenylcysteine carboxylmethyltransferase family protein [[Brevibacterium] frigoritolerans]|nr:isoprenylcysteine carboxylmethyltransferase family protein [Peribacillus frigoritolerans]
MAALNFPSQFAQSVLGLTLLLWVIIEYRIMTKQNKRPKKKDIKAILLFSFITLTFVILSIQLFRDHIGYLDRSLDSLFWVGISVIYMGIYFRQYSMRIMGNQYVATLQIQDKPGLITKGPFKTLRHPCYTGFMVALWGLAITFLNWIFIIMVILFSLFMFLSQIRIEERELLKYFGDDYEEYKKRTKKLIPFIL